MATLPVFTETIDNAFVETWYDIKAQAVDNILDALVVWNVLRNRGVLKTQVGSDMITETIKYGRAATPKWIKKGSLLTSGEQETETMAIWNWKYSSTHVQRDIIDDQKNAGQYKIKSYIAKRLKEAREEIEQNFESLLDGAWTSGEANDDKMMGLNHLLPGSSDKATGTFGGINRSETWWQANYKTATAVAEVNLVSDMRNLFNTVHNNQIPPDLLITTQTIYEIYEDFGLDAIQISGDKRLLDLGFETLKFKGQDMIWTPNTTSGTIKMLNTDFISIYYDPKLWFDMTKFKDTANSTARIAHIISALQMTGTQPRRHGLLESIS